jgi:tRNA G37 N-methylase TrmD
VSSDTEGFVQPLLDETQYSPSGLLRPNLIPLVMISGGDEAVDLMRRARGVGVRRRYHFLSQGIRIGNLIVL